MIMRVATRQLCATRRTIFVAALMILTAAGTAQLRPAPQEPHAAPDLEAMLPERFGDWRRVSVSSAVLPEQKPLGPGEAVSYRAYRDDTGKVVTLVVAYGPPLGDSVRLHRPEKCYPAQGFAVVSRTQTQAALAGVAATLVRLQTQGPVRPEAVTYWLRAGAHFTTDDASIELRAFRRGSKFDGALVRVSTNGAGGGEFQIQAQFLSTFATALTPQARALLLTGAGVEAAV
jgi:EpsI family protein